MTRFYQVGTPAELHLPVNLSMGVPRVLEVFDPATKEVTQVELVQIVSNSFVDSYCDDRLGMLVPVVSKPFTHAVYKGKPVEVLA